MPGRKPIQEVPSALRVTLEKAQAEYTAGLRKVRWGEGPLYVCAAGNCAGLGVAATYAFESFAGRPVVERPPEVFLSHGLGLFGPRSLLLMVSANGDWPEAEDLARTVRERGGAVIALTDVPESALVKLADPVFFAAAEAANESPARAVCMHAALNLLAFESMRALKKPQPWWEVLAKELNQLPEKLDWVFTQLAPAVRSLAAEATRGGRLTIIGAGFYHYPALHAARRLRDVCGQGVAGIEVSEFLDSSAWFAGRGDTVLLLSGSQSKMKKVMPRAAAQARANGARVLSLTDANDRDLAQASDLAFLIPAILEPPAGTLMLFMLEWLALEARTAGSAPLRA